MKDIRSLSALAAGLFFCLAATVALGASTQHSPLLALESDRSVYPVQEVQVIVDNEKTLSLEEIRRLEACVFRTKPRGVSEHAEGCLGPSRGPSRSMPRGSVKG